MDTDTLAGPDEQQFEWVLVPPAPAPGGDDPAWQAEAAELRSRKTELDRRRKNLKEREAEIDRRGTGRDQEASLDDMRRAFVTQWETIDELKNLLDTQSTWLDQRRNELAQQEQDLKSLSERRNSLFKQMTDTREREGRSGRFRKLLREFRNISEENRVKNEQVGAAISEYNLQYDDFLHALDTKMPVATELIADFVEWIEKRRAHNEQINKYNADKRLLETSIGQWRYEESRLQKDVREFLGPLRLTSDSQKALRHQLDQVIWLSGDQNIAGRLFELLCVDLLNTIGLRVIHSGGSDDNGIDLTAVETTRLGAELQYFIQCKLRSKDGEKGKVGRNEMSKFIGDLSSNPEDRKIFMTLGEFDDAARERSEARGVDLWDGSKLLERLLREEVGFIVQFNTDGFQCRINSEYWENLEN